MHVNMHPYFTGEDTIYVNIIHECLRSLVRNYISFLVISNDSTYLYHSTEKYMSSATKQ